MPTCSAFVKFCWVAAGDGVVGARLYERLALLWYRRPTFFGAISESSFCRRVMRVRDFTSRRLGHASPVALFGTSPGHYHRAGFGVTPVAGHSQENRERLVGLDQEQRGQSKASA